MSYLKYVLYGTISVFTTTTLISLILGATMENKILGGLTLMLFTGFIWFPAVLINAGIICYKNKE